MDAVTAQLAAAKAQVVTLAAPVTDKIVATPAYAAAADYYSAAQPYMMQITSDEWAAITCVVLPALFVVFHFIWAVFCCGGCKPSHTKVAPAPPPPARNPLPKKGDKPQPPPKKGSPSPPPKGKGSPAPPKGKNGKSLVA